MTNFQSCVDLKKGFVKRVEIKKQNNSFDYF
jgi:hypothetical protein